MSVGNKKNWEELYWGAMESNRELHLTIKSKDYRIKKLLEYLDHSISKIPEDDLWYLNEERDFLANFKESSNEIQ